VARWAAVAGGVLGVLLAVVNPTVLGQLTVFYSVMSVCLFVPIVVGLHTRRPGVPEVLTGIAAGVSVLFAVRLSGITDTNRLLDPTLLRIVASAAAFALVFLVRRPSASNTDS